MAYTVEILPFAIRAKGFAVMVSPGHGKVEIGLLSLPAELYRQRDPHFQPIRQSRSIESPRMEVLPLVSS